MIKGKHKAKKEGYSFNNFIIKMLESSRKTEQTILKSQNRESKHSIRTETLTTLAGGLLPVGV